MNREINTVLPIGTIVQLIEGNRYLMIMGRFHRNLENSEIYDYAGCLYPEGYQGGTSYYLFNHEHIDKIISMGFEDEKELKYRQAIINEIKKIQ